MGESIAQKKCSKCGRFRAATKEFFYSEKRAKDGLTSACKDCANEYRLEHKDQRNATRRRTAQEHKEVIRAQKKRHYEKHKDDIRQYKNRYAQEHKESMQEYQRKYHQDHKEKRLEQSRIYNQEHHDTVVHYKKMYYQQHRESTLLRVQVYNQSRREKRRLYLKWYAQTAWGRSVLNAASQRRRVRKLAVPGTLTKEQIHQKLKAQKYCCYYAACGYAKFEKRDGNYVYHIEHTIPLSRPEMGPRHDVNYTVLACPSCNLKKHNRLPHEFLEGGRLF